MEDANARARERILRLIEAEERALADAAPSRSVRCEASTEAVVDVVVATTGGEGFLRRVASSSSPFAGRRVRAR